MENYDTLTLAKKIIKFCISQNKKFIFIAGNGASGKTQLSKILSKEASKYGSVNILDTDDFVVNTKLRNSATAIWKDSKNKTQKGRYTTSFAESYFLQSINAIIYNLEKGNNYYHWPKKAKFSRECRLLHKDAILNIIEGVGTVFLYKNKSNSLSIFLQCRKEVEFNRRITRAEKSNEKKLKEVKKYFSERYSQYESQIKTHINEYNIILESLEDFSLKIIRDNFNILT